MSTPDSPPPSKPSKPKRTRKKPPRGPTGAPSKIGKAGPRICELIARGAPKTRAAAAAGVTRDTFHRWMAEGLEAGPRRAPQRAFRTMVEAALDAYVNRLMEAATEPLDTTECDDCAGSGESAATRTGKCRTCRGKGYTYVYDVQHRISAVRFIGPHRFPEDFSTRQETRNTGADGGPIQVQAEVKVAPLLTDEQIAALSPEQLAAAIGALVGQGAE